MSEEFQIVSRKKKSRKIKIEYNMYSDASGWHNPTFVSVVEGVNEAEALASRKGFTKWWHIHNPYTDNVIDYYGTYEISRGHHPHPEPPQLEEETTNE
mgnify:CR=1 FL=1